MLKQYKRFNLAGNKAQHKNRERSRYLQAKLLQPKINILFY